MCINSSLIHLLLLLRQYDSYSGFKSVCVSRCVFECVYLFVHDKRQLSGQVSVAGLHLIVILLLIFLYQPLIHTQSLATSLHKLPTDTTHTHTYTLSRNPIWTGLDLSRDL